MHLKASAPEKICEKKSRLPIACTGKIWQLCFSIVRDTADVCTYEFLLPTKKKKCLMIVQVRPWLEDVFQVHRSDRPSRKSTLIWNSTEVFADYACQPRTSIFARIFTSHYRITHNFCVMTFVHVFIMTLVCNRDLLTRFVQRSRKEEESHFYMWWPA